MFAWIRALFDHFDPGGSVPALCVLDPEPAPTVPAMYPGTTYYATSVGDLYITEFDATSEGLAVPEPTQPWYN